MRGFAVVVHPRHPDDRHHRRDPDAHDDRALVSLAAPQSPAVLRSASSCASFGSGPTTPTSTSCASGASRSRSRPSSRSLTVVLFLTIGLNFGIDFKGGTLMEMQAKSGKADVGQVRQTAESFGFGEVEVQEFGDDGRASRCASRIQPGGEAAQSAVVAEGARRLRQRLRVPPRRDRRSARLGRTRAVRHHRRRALGHRGAVLSLVPLRAANSRSAPSSAPCTTSCSRSASS